MGIHCQGSAGIGEVVVWRFTAEPLRLGIGEVMVMEIQGWGSTIRA